MADITLSSAVRNNLLSLQKTASLLGKTQERLATGLKVNSALDDPTAFFTASSLNSRAGDLNRLLDSLSNGIQTIEAADNGLTAITTTVESLQATVNQARQDASFKSSSYSVDSTAIGTSIAKNLSFSGGSVGATAVDIALNTAGTPATQSTVTASADYVAPTAAVQSTVASSADYVAPTAATAGSQSFTFAGNPITFTDAADTISFEIEIDGNGPPTAVTITQAHVLAAGNTNDTIDDAAEFEAVLNAALTAAGVNGDLTVTRNGNDFTIESNDVGSTSSIAITNPAVNDDNANDASLSVANTGLNSLTTTAGEDAEDRVITISDGTNTANITLTSANAGDAATARAYIDAQLTAQSVTGITVGGAGDRIDLTGEADGSNSITIGGADADDVFGAGAVTTAGAEAEDRVITISDGTNTANITLTSANAGDAATARAYIDAQLTAQSVAGITVGGAGDRIDLAGAADGSNSIAIGGANADDVFGAGAAVVAGVESTGGSVQTVDQLVTAINAHADLVGKVRASNENGNLRIENLSLENLTTTGVTSGAIDGGVGTAVTGGNEVRKDLVNQFNTLRNELNKLADDASFNGINLLRGDVLKLNFNESGSSNISIQAKDSEGNVRAINATNLDIDSADNDEFGSNTTLDARREALANALNTLRTQASQFGSNLSIVQNRQDFTKNIINTLQTGAANLTLADTNEEGANLLALQTRQQLSSVALSMASQADQNVLRLF